MALTEALAKMGDTVVIAPAEERSGFSQAITIMKPFRVEQRAESSYAVYGTPADCVVYGLFHVLKGRRPDWVVSGINRGANLGDDTLYSGTVGAAMEAAYNGFPALAVSLVTEGRQRGVYHYEAAASVVSQLLAQAELKALAKNRVLNVNVPNCPFEMLKGSKVTELSRRHYDRGLKVETRSDGMGFCSYGSGPVSHDGQPGNDAHAVDQDYVALSLLQPSMFDPLGNESLRNIWPSDPQLV